jgi:hypothetical protein
MLRSPRTQQNIGTKHLIPVTKTFDTFLREFLEAKAQAEGVLARNARGDFSPDRNADRFPEWTPVSNEQRLPGLWKEFVADRQVSRGTQKKYKGILDALVARIGTDDMSAVTEGHLSAWIDELKKIRACPQLSQMTAAAKWMGSPNPSGKSRQGMPARYR